jgi:hypothetical protein
MGDRRLDAVVKQPENPDNGRLTHCVFFIAEDHLARSHNCIWEIASDLKK